MSRGCGRSRNGSRSRNRRRIRNRNGTRAGAVAGAGAAGQGQGKRNDYLECPWDRSPPSRNAAIFRSCSSAVKAWLLCGIVV